MKRYPAYKDSGVEWIGEIPEGWALKKLKHLAKVRLSNIDKKSNENEIPVRLCNYLDVYYNERITSDIQFMGATTPEEKLSPFTLKAGDVLITKDSESPDDIAVPAYVPQSLPGIVCGYHLALIRPYINYADGNYLFRSFTANGIRDQFEVAANGITRFGIGKYSIDNSLFLAPSIEEQQNIASYLDHKTCLIDTLIEKKQKQIELLQEQRTAIINQAVTKGLNPNARMKDSGIEWLGEVPEHWEVRKLGYLGSFIRGRGISRADITDIGVPAITYGDIYTRYGVETKQLEKYTSELVATNAQEILKGDLLFTASGETIEDIGKTTLYSGDIPGYAGGDIIILRPTKGDSLYLSYALNSDLGIQQKSLFGRGDIIVHIAASQLKQIVVSFPPKEEQTSIAEFLDNVLKYIRTTISLAQREIDLIQEYRTTLISEAVTGKIDVREEVRT